MSTYLLAYIVSEFTSVSNTQIMSTDQEVLVRSRARSPVLSRTGLARAGVLLFTPAPPGRQAGV